jgi:hypothetical protein
MLDRAMQPILLRALFGESGRIVRSARAAQVRVRERCTTAAPKRVTRRQNTSPLGATNRFVTYGASQVGRRNSAGFLSMQRPKPVDTGPSMSGF